MGYTIEEIHDVITLKNKGMSHRDISEVVFGKRTAASSVFDILRKNHPDYIEAVVSRVHKSSPSKKDKALRIMFIPDAQVKKGVKLNHLNALGNYIADKQPDVIVNIGDFADMASLSQWEKAGSKASEGARYSDDIEAVHEAMEVLLAPIRKVKGYSPRMILTLGNHEDRITRAIHANPRHFEGVISLGDLRYEAAGWEVYPFLEMVEVGGIFFSHYFVNPNSLTKNVIGGTMDTKLKNLGFSFAMGHQQILQMGLSYRTNGDCIQGLVAGAFYMHDEGYMGYQGNKSHWRGAIMLNDVKNGQYDIMPLSMDYLLDNWDF